MRFLKVFDMAPMSLDGRTEIKQVKRHTQRNAVRFLHPRLYAFFTSLSQYMRVIMSDSKRVLTSIIVLFGLLSRYCITSIVDHGLVPLIVGRFFSPCN